MKTTVLKLSTLAMGIALFVTLTLCLQVPVFENYYLCLGYVVMAVYCYSFGAFQGTAVGFFGVIIYCLITGGLRGLPGWAVGNIIIGIFLGITFKFSKNIKYSLLRYVIISLSIVLSCAIGILGIKSAIECILYAQPFIIRAINNSYAFFADVFVLFLSLPICNKMNVFIKKKFTNM